MHIGLLQAVIDIPSGTSLKAKRKVLKSLKDRTVAHMNVSVAEVGQHELWNRAELAFVTVAAEKKVVDQRLSKLMTTLENGAEFILLEVRREDL